MSKVVEYSDIEGVKQITRNSLKAKGVLRIYELVYASLNEIFDSQEASDIRKEFVENKIIVQELTNSPYRDIDTSDVKGFDRLTEIRYIDPKNIQYETEIVIYNDTVAFYRYGANPYGLEIIDSSFAQTQKQIFDQLWRKASRPVIGKGGRSSLL